MAKMNVYQIVTASILSMLKDGVCPWRMPWKNGGIPRNFNSKRPYRGVNILILMFQAMNKKYTSPYWITFNKVREAGGNVRKGEKSTMVVYWNVFYVDENGNVIKGKKLKEARENGEKIETKFGLRYYNVFNIQQCEGLDTPEVKELNFTPIDACENVVNNMANKPIIKHDRQQAFYHVKEDYVNMPDQKTFESVESYYTTLFHELTHATGHETRVGRESIKECKPRNIEDYSREELVAELGASFLSAITGIEDKTLKNSASYIDNWIKKINEDDRLIVTASQQAQKAVDYILGENQ